MRELTRVARDLARYVRATRRFGVMAVVVGVAVAVAIGVTISSAGPFVLYPLL